MMMQNVRSSIHNTLHWLVLLPMLLLASCAGSDSEEAHDTPALSDIPVSFKAESKWDEDKTRLSESTTGTGNTVSFEKDDQIGIFAYYNNSTTPNFMNNQLATCTTDGSWSYSPVKYWPNNEKDDISFYAYYPYRESEDKTLSVSSSFETPLTIEYNCPNADIDLMVAKEEDLKYSSSAGKVSLGFKHLLARVKFTFTYENKDDIKDDYHPVIHILKYTIPYYKGTLVPYAFNQEATEPSKNWKKIEEPVQVVRYVADAAGTVLHEQNQLIDEFTAYLLPCKFPYSDAGTDKVGSFFISLNNKLYAYTPKSKISVEAGTSYTVNFKIEKENNDNGSNYFITSYSIWKDGGTLIGTLQ